MVTTHDTEILRIGNHLTTDPIHTMTTTRRMRIIGTPLLSMTWAGIMVATITPVPPP